MTRALHEHHHRAPSAVAFMARALVPSPGLPKDGSFPQLVQEWEGCRIEPDHHAWFCEATGLRTDRVSILYPHVLGFRLQMALLTHPSYPLPIWNALQIRNQLVLHREIEIGETLTLETRSGEHRLLEKGVEVDLVSRLARGPDCCWESVVTYFYRGRFKAADTAGAPAPGSNAPDLSQTAAVDRFRMPDGGGWRFSKLTGDYNGIHNWSWYARRLGFRSAFFHPQRVAGICMAKLHQPQTDAQTLRLWIKGPVYYGVNAILNADAPNDGVRFGLSLEGDSRVAIVGHWVGA